MSGGSGIKAPKTLADVSHLFFSSLEDRGKEERPPRARTGSSDPSGDGGRGPTRCFAVTGDGFSPGKSTIAVNLALALSAHGQVGLFDADPHIPNARFYLGFPSWHYLSPLTGDGRAAPSTLVDSGLVVVDWTAPEPGSVGRVSSARFSVRVAESGTHELDYAVIDVPVSRLDVVRGSGFVPATWIVVAQPGRSGFQGSFAVLSRLAKGYGLREAGLVVNRVPRLSYAEAFHAKIRLAAERLLSMKVGFLGGLIVEPHLGSEQRERGVLVRSRPDAAAALLLRQIASRALEFQADPGATQTSRRTFSERRLP